MQENIPAILEKINNLYYGNNETFISKLEEKAKTLEDSYLYRTSLFTKITSFEDKAPLRTPKDFSGDKALLNSPSLHFKKFNDEDNLNLLPLSPCDYVLPGVKETNYQPITFTYKEYLDAKRKIIALHANFSFVKKLTVCPIIEEVISKLFSQVEKDYPDYIIEYAKKTSSRYVVDYKSREILEDSLAFLEALFTGLSGNDAELHNLICYLYHGKDRILREHPKVALYLLELMAQKQNKEAFFSLGYLIDFCFNIYNPRYFEYFKKLSILAIKTHIHEGYVFYHALVKSNKPQKELLDEITNLHASYPLFEYQDLFSLDDKLIQLNNKLLPEGYNTFSKFFYNLLNFNETTNFKYEEYPFDSFREINEEVKTLNYFNDKESAFLKALELVEFDLENFKIDETQYQKSQPAIIKMLFSLPLFLRENRLKNLFLALKDFLYFLNTLDESNQEKVKGESPKKLLEGFLSKNKSQILKALNILRDNFSDRSFLLEIYSLWVNLRENTRFSSITKREIKENLLFTQGLTQNEVFNLGSLIILGKFSLMNLKSIDNLVRKGKDATDLSKGLISESDLVFLTAIELLGNIRKQKLDKLSDEGKIFNDTQWQMIIQMFVMCAQDFNENALLVLSYLRSIGLFTQDENWQENLICSYNEKIKLSKDYENLGDMDLEYLDILADYEFLFRNNPLSKVYESIFN